MRKKIAYTVAAAAMLASNVAFSGNNESEKLCNPPGDPVARLICNLSRKLKSPPLKVGTAMVLASFQMTGTFCDFRFSRKFLDGRINAENDPEIGKVVNYLISENSGDPPPGYNGNKKVFCKIQHETYGPNSDAKIFE